MTPRHASDGETRREAYPHDARGRAGRLARACALALVAVAAAATHAVPAARDHEIRAAMLVNFTRFVEWPTHAWSDSAAPFLIGVVGRAPLGAALDLAAGGKRVGARPIVVRRWTDAGAARDGAQRCQMLYFADDAGPEAASLLRELDGTPVLVIGDAPGFASRGGTVGFFVEARHLGFEINRRAAERGGLRVSSKLLELARLVETRRP